MNQTALLLLSSVASHSCTLRICWSRT